MKFYTAYYGQRYAETVSLLVQQATVGKKRERVLLAGVIVAEKKTSAEKTGVSGWKDFFAEDLLVAVARNPDKALERLKKRMLKKAMIKEDGGPCSLAMMVCVGDRAMLITSGECNIYLLQRRFSKVCIECLDVENGEMVVLEPGARILLTAGVLEEHFRMEAVAAGLGKERITGEKQLARRLEDLGELECGKDEGAAMIVVCCEQEERGIK